MFEEQWDLLCRAEQLIVPVRDALKGNSELCPCCGLTTYLDKHQWKMQQMLDVALNRLRKCQEEFRILAPNKAGAPRPTLE